MFVTQVGVSESRFVTVERLETINEVTGKEFPVSGDAPLRMAQRLLQAKMNKAYRTMLENRNRYMVEHEAEVPC